MSRVQEFQGLAAIFEFPDFANRNLTQQVAHQFANEGIVFHDQHG